MSIKRAITAAVVLALAAGWAAAGAAGDGGPSPGVSWGWDGVAALDGKIRYVTLPSGKTTTVAVVRVDGGRVVRYGSIPGSFGVPLVAYDGSAGGLAHDGRTLVLSTFAGPSPQASTRLAVLDAR